MGDLHFWLTADLLNWVLHFHLSQSLIRRAWDYSGFIGKWNWVFFYQLSGATLLGRSLIVYFSKVIEHTKRFPSKPLNDSTLSLFPVYMFDWGQKTHCCLQGHNSKQQDARLWPKTQPAQLLTFQRPGYSPGIVGLPVHLGGLPSADKMGITSAILLWIPISVHFASICGFSHPPLVVLFARSLAAVKNANTLRGICIIVIVTLFIYFYTPETINIMLIVCVNNPETNTYLVTFLFSF